MIRRKDLADIADNDYNQRRGEELECQDCGLHIRRAWSDYNHLAMDDVIYCPRCKRDNIAIVRMVKRWVIVKK